jgi:hypothetical protein
MLNELGNIGDFVGGLAVVATLAYLAFQIRQNTATTRVQTIQHLLTSDTAAADSTLAGPVPEILAKLRAGEELSPTEISVYTLHVRARMTAAWQVFYQLQNKMIDRDVANPLLERYAFFVQQGLFRHVWTHTLKSGYSPEFQDYVESLMNENVQQKDALR